jgi:hypothetical protein
MMPNRRQRKPVAAASATSALATNRAGTTAAMAAISKKDTWLATTRPAPRPANGRSSMTSIRTPSATSRRAAASRANRRRTAPGNGATTTANAVSQLSVMISRAMRTQRATADARACGAMQPSPQGLTGNHP